MIYYYRCNAVEGRDIDDEGAILEPEVNEGIVEKEECRQWTIRWDLVRVLWIKYNRNAEDLRAAIRAASEMRIEGLR